MKLTTPEDFNFNFSLERPEWLKEIYNVIKTQYDALKKEYFSDDDPITWKDFFSITKVVRLFQFVFKIVASVEIVAVAVEEKCIVLGDTDANGKLSSEEKLDLAAKCVDDIVGAPLWLESWDRKYIIKPAICLIVTALNLLLAQSWYKKLFGSKSSSVLKRIFAS